MTTIEERANLAAIKDTSKGRNRIDYSISAMADHENGFREGYIDGATEQKVIDIEKACKVHCSCCMAYSACSRCGKFCCWELDKIRKAMEE